MEITEPRTPASREQRGAHLVLLSALTSVNVLATFALLAVYRPAGPLFGTAGLLALGLSWSVWIRSLGDWLRPLASHRDGS